MEVRIADIDSSTLCDLFSPCRACVYWECPDRFSEQFTEEEVGLKSGWFRTTTVMSGTCGKLLYLDDAAVAYCQYAPITYVPGISRYKGLMPHVDKSDAAFITCLVVKEDCQRKGLGRRLLQDVIDGLKERGCKALQTIARDDSPNNCSGPTRFYQAEGFKVVATETYSDGSSYSLVRLDLI